MFILMFRFELFSILLCTFLNKFVYLDPDICKYEELELKEGASRYVNIEYANFVVAVIIWDEENGFNYCTGTILNNTYVVTSAHCLMNYKCERDRETRQYSCNQLAASNYEVVAGTNYIISPEQSVIRSVKRVLIHPGFMESAEYNFDVGLLELETPYVYSNKIGYRRVNNKIYNYYNRFIGKSSNFTVYTYGNSPCSTVISPEVRRNSYTLLSGEKFQRLQEIQIYPSNDIECEKLYFEYLQVGIDLNTNHFLCGQIRNVIPNCEDWSGSPMVVPNKSVNTAYLIAMIMQPITCEPTNYILLLRLSALSAFITGVPSKRKW